MMAKGTTKSGGQKHGLDKFYTKSKIVAECLKFLPLPQYSLIIEPSAGNGAFSSQIAHSNLLAFDIEPEAEGIITQDWLTYKQERVEHSSILVVGNPPFGQQNTLAVKFINHAAEFADRIAFILPASFEKESTQNRLNRNLHLTLSTRLPNNSFLLNGEEIQVPCVFQIWDYKTNQLRPTPLTLTAQGFRFVKKTEQPDLYIQRVGGNAGKVGLDWAGKNPQSHYFLKANEGWRIEEVFAELQKLTHPHKDSTVGPRSISKKEILLELYSLQSPLI